MSFENLVECFGNCGRKKKALPSRLSSRIIYLVGAVCQPLMVVSELQHILGVGPICSIDFTVNNIVTITCVASLFHLVIISRERYVAIKHALRYITLVTTRRVTAWLLPISLTVVKDGFYHVVETVLIDLFTGILVCDTI